MEVYSINTFGIFKRKDFLSNFHANNKKPMFLYEKKLMSQQQKEESK